MFALGARSTLVLVLLLGAGRCLGAGSDPITCSSVESWRMAPDQAFDGDPQTRWSSQGTGGSQWLQVDLGRHLPVDALDIHWEAAYSAQWQLLLSDDGEHWRLAYERMDGREETTSLRNLGNGGRFIRINCLRPAAWPNCSIWEVTSPDEALQAAMREAHEAMARERQRASREAASRATEALAGVGATEVLFAVRHPGLDGHWYANFSYYAEGPQRTCYRPAGGKLCALDLATGEVRTIFEDPEGSVRDPQVHYDGRRIVFSYLRGAGNHFHLWEINSDGTGLRQLTAGDYDDIEPCYLPDGGIAFCSSRSKRWVQCWLTQVATLYRCDADGQNMRMLSANVEQDNTPWVLPDGRLSYTRWEYIDRSQVDYHHLWAMDPDGTNQTVTYGNLHPGTVMIDAKPIPGTRDVLSIFSPGHGAMEHAGELVRVDFGDGPDNPAMVSSVAPGGGFRDPYSLGGSMALAAVGTELQFCCDGVVGTVYHLPEEDARRGMWLHEPRPLAPRPREVVIQPRVDVKQATGRLLLQDVTRGRNMTGVKPGGIAKLLVVESLPKPINYTGGMDPLTLGGSFTLERLVGTVPVEADGSAYMELPALRSFFFIALDANDNTVKRMQSFTTVQPGELTGCVGCHEQRTQVLPISNRPLAIQRAPSTPQPVAGVPEVFDFPRDIQPILDRHCVACHDTRPTRAADGSQQGPRCSGVLLAGDRGPVYSHGYYMLTVWNQFADGRNRAVSNLAPRTIGAVASPLMRKLSGGHHGVQASPAEIATVRYWIETAAPYPGTYAALGSGMIGGYYENYQVGTDDDWPTTRAGAEVIERRCASCHTGDRALPHTLSQEGCWRHDRHIVFNLTRPDQSVILLAPLSREAGGWDHWSYDGKPDKPVFADTSDPDYQTLLGMITEGKRRLEEMTRFDMPGFRPPVPYLRELVRYGVLAQMPTEGQPVDPYALDQAYWRSLWWVPEG